MRKLLRKLRYLLGRDRRADDLAEELELHRSLVEREGLEEGLAPEEARRRARRRMGNETLARENARSVWSFPIVDELLQDLRYGVRVLSRNRGSTVVTVLVLAIGIGVNTAVFTAYKSMVARPLDARNPEEMVNIALTRDSGRSSTKFSYSDYETYRDSIRSFSGLAAFRYGGMTISNTGPTASHRTHPNESFLGILGLGGRGGSVDELAAVTAVSENYFEVFGVTALRGRTFQSIGSSELVAEPSVLISETYWQNRFAGDPAIIGRTIHLNGVPVTIIGITPRDFSGTGRVPAFWIPLSIEPLLNTDDQWLHDRENERYRLVGRLAPGVSIAQAQAEMTPIADQLRALHDPQSESADPAVVLVWPGSPMPLPIEMNKTLQWVILLIASATGIVLVVACANVASLQLARARSRENELRTRLSLGAGRLRVIRQLLTESALVGLLAGMLALLLTWALLKELAIWLAHVVDYALDATPDLEVFVYVLAISLLAGMLSGLAPALESSRAALAAGVRAGTSSVRSRRLQDLLVTAQVSLSLVLLIAAGMFIRSSLNVLNTPTGYDSEQVVFLGVPFSRTSEYTDVRKLTLIRQLRTRLATLPGVATITSAPQPMLETRFETVAVPLDEGTGEGQNAQSLLGYTYVESNYFQTLGIPVLLGRSFQQQAGRPEQSVVLSESAADQLWPNQNPIGRGIRLGPTDEQRHRRSELAADGPAYQVVGVAGDKRLVGYGGRFSNEIYLPLPEGRLHSRPILIRVEADPNQIRRAIEPVISSIDPNMGASFTATLEEMLRLSTPFLVSSAAATVATAVGACGLVLALIGIYGTVSYVVVLRTREVGIRMAMGAQRGHVLGLILRETVRPVLVGLLFGMIIAVGVSYFGRSLFYGIDSIDGVSLAGVSTLFLAVALLASYLPARRALRVDPLVALRYE